jgi:hypothetical protein
VGGPDGAPGGSGWSTTRAPNDRGGARSSAIWGPRCGRYCTFVALQSLFRFAKRRRLIFADPIRRLHIGHVARVLLPMTDIQIAPSPTPRSPRHIGWPSPWPQSTPPAACVIRELTVDGVDLASGASPWPVTRNGSAGSCTAHCWTNKFDPLSDPRTYPR